MELEGTQNGQNDPEKQQSRRTHVWTSILLQSSNNQPCGRSTRTNPCDTTENPEVTPYVVEATDFQQEHRDHPTWKGDFLTQALNNRGACASE